MLYRYTPNTIEQSSDADSPLPTAQWYHLFGVDLTAEDETDHGA